MLVDLIRRDRGDIDAERFDKFRRTGDEEFGATAKELLHHTPALFGKCAPMSAMWAAMPRDRHGIPVVAVAGDLIIEGRTAFLCDKNIPNATDADTTRLPEWDGHCWIEIDGCAGDISIFRTARMIVSVWPRPLE
jgi:hypothetical protein